MVRSFMFYIVIMLVLSCGICPAFSDSSTPMTTTDSKDQAIHELLQVMNTIQNMETTLDTMQDTIKMNSPYFLKELKVILSRDLEEKDVEHAAELFNKDDFGSSRLYELFRYKFNLERVKKEVMLPVYQKYYTEAEIRKLIEFYTSDLGQKTLKLTSAISGEISSKTRDISHMALSQAKDELAFELKQKIRE